MSDTENILPEIPYEVRHVFTLHHLMYVWEEFRTLGFDTRILAADLWREYEANSRGQSSSRFFLEYGQKVLNPLVNERLNRPIDHPSFVKLLEHCLKPFIEKDGYLNFQKLNGNFN